MIFMKGYLNNRFVIVYDNNLKSKLINKGYGLKKEDSLELDLFESFYLFEKKKIEIYYKDKKINKDEFIKKIEKKIKNFQEKYLVYKDLKKDGYRVKDGAIFGFDFRVYEKETDKHTHTKFVVDVKSTHKDEMSKVIKSERLANSINTKYVIAIVDFDKKITKIKLERI